MLRGRPIPEKTNLVPKIQRNEDAVVVEVVSRRVHGLITGNRWVAMRLQGV